MRHVTNIPSPTRKYHRWTIGDRLTVARKSVTPSQLEFAAMVGLSISSVRLYETRSDSYRRKPHFMDRWAEITDFDLGWIKTGIEPDDGDGGGRILDFPPTDSVERDDNLPTCRHGETPVLRRVS